MSNVDDAIERAEDVTYTETTGGEAWADRRMLAAEVKRLQVRADRFEHMWDEANAEVDRLRAQVADVEAVWSMWRDDEGGSMPWKFVRDMDVVLASGDEARP